MLVEVLLLLLTAPFVVATCLDGPLYEQSFDKCVSTLCSKMCSQVANMANIQPRFYLGAEQRCNQLGGYLVAIQNQFENVYVSGIV